MMKLREVYVNNSQLGDPNTISEKLEQNARVLAQYQGELKKFQVSGSVGNVLLSHVTNAWGWNN